MTTCRRVAFTFFPPDAHLDCNWFDAIVSIPKLSYAVWQRETCPSTARLHLQGYLEFSDPTGWAPIKRKLPGVHLEKCIGDRASNYRYCTDPEKRSPGDSGPWEWRSPQAARLEAAGGAGGQGSRNDIAAFRDAIRAGTSDSDLWLMYPELMARYPRMVPHVRASFAKRRDAIPEVHIYFGPPGSGKSRAADEMAPRAYRKVRGMWWDMYSGESDVIVDDFYGPDDYPYPEWLKLTDWYDYMAPIKGGFVKVNPKRIFFTSNRHPRDWYCAQPEYVARAFFRRVHSIRQYHLDGTWMEIPPSALYDD